MLFRLFSDSSFVSNVDLYYINNSQVYGGLFLFNKQKKNISDTKNQSTENHSFIFVPSKSVKFYFTCIPVVTLCKSRCSR